MKKICIYLLILIIICSGCSNHINNSSFDSNLINFESSVIEFSDVSTDCIDKEELKTDTVQIPTDNVFYHTCDRYENFDLIEINYDISDMIKNIKDNIIDDSSQVTFDISYTYKDIIFARKQNMLYPGGDYAAWAYKGSGIWWGDTCKLLTFFTPEHCRFYKDKYYCIYDVKDYGRLYFYFSDINDFEYPVGYPMLVSKKYKLDDFNDIQPGDSIFKIIDIDKVTEIYYAQFIMSKVSSESIQYSKEYGKTICSLHYLDEGILRIEYDVLDNGEYVVADKVLLENYQFTDYKGRLIDLSIMEGDLP